MEQAKLSSLPKGGKCFLKPLYHDREYIILSKSFVREFPDIKLFARDHLCDPAGNIFEPQVKTVSKQVHLKGGLEQIRATHQIDLSVTFHFTYICQGCFNIRIFFNDDNEVDFEGQEEQHPNDEGEFIWFPEITHALAAGGQTLLIPAGVVTKHLEHRPSALNMILLNGITEVWEPRWAKDRPRKRVFATRWYQFCRGEV